MDNQIVSVPVGYRFRPTNEELLKHYLLAKVTNGYHCPGIINELDVYAYQPWDLPGMDEEESEGYYFTQRIKKYPNGKRPSRFVYVQGSDDEARPQSVGHWKMSCKVDDIRDRHGMQLGKKNFLNYFRGSVKTEWKMHEFILDPSLEPPKRDGRSNTLDEVVLCRIYTTDSKRGKAAEMPQIRGSEGPLNQQMISCTPEPSRPPLKRKQPPSHQQEQSDAPALAAAPMQLSVEQPPAHTAVAQTQTVVAQVPWAAEPLAQPVGAQHYQNHVVNLAQPQAEEPAANFVPNEAQVPQGGDYASPVRQLQSEFQDISTWAQCGNLEPSRRD